MAGTAHNSAHEAGKAFTEATNPGMEDAVRARYEPLLPGLAHDLFDLNGRTHTRGVLPQSIREPLTIAAQGGQTRPQPKIQVAAHRLGVTQEENAEAIDQMGLYGGMPAMFNALNAAIEVFDAEAQA